MAVWVGLSRQWTDVWVGQSQAYTFGRTAPGSDIPIMEAGPTELLLYLPSPVTTLYVSHASTLVYNQLGGPRVMLAYCLLSRRS